MPSMLSRLRTTEPDVSRSWQQLFSFNGTAHYVTAMAQPTDPRREQGGVSFTQVVTEASEAWSVVDAAVDARALLMSQLRFTWVGIVDANRGRRFGTADLTVLEDAPGGVPMSELLVRFEQDVCFAGNAYMWVDPSGTARRLRPDWVQVILTSTDATAEVAGYSYRPGGHKSGNDQPAVLIDRRDVAHFRPSPHPLHVGIGRSWVTTLVRDLMTYELAEEHVARFFENAATPQMIVQAPAGVTEDQFRNFIAEMDAAASGPGKAGRTLYVANGTDAQVVGSRIGDLDMKNVSGAIENRVSVRSRVPAVMLGTRESQQGSALNSGNYAQTRRLWADSWFAPHAQMLCDVIHEMMRHRGAVPPGSRLTYDPTVISFLQEDLADAADIAAKQAVAIETLHRAGFRPDAAVQAVQDGDMRRLTGQHTGLSSVQLVEPESGQQTEGTDDV